MSAIDDHTQTESDGQLGELAQVDPTTLVIGVNSRREVQLDPHFCRDIADRGVREPIIVRRDGDGRLVVRKGQRRTLAAVRSRLPLVRVLIEAEPNAPEDDVTGQVERIVDQYGENFHRAALSEADEARAHQQLLDLGLTAGQIARRTHTPAPRVRALHAVTASPMARAALSGIGGPALRLDHAAVVAEFDDGAADSAEAVEVLLEAAERSPERFGHIAQRLRDDRDERRLVAEHTQTLTAQGLRVLTDDESAATTELCMLRPTADSPPGTQIDPQEHTCCPGHAVHLSMRMDWSTKEQRIEATPYCTEADWHAPRFDRDTGSGPALEFSEHQVEEAKEQQRAERRRVIANNKKWESAAAHRRQWLAEFIARKKPPVDAAAFIALTLAAGSHDVRKAMESGSPTACALLGLPAPAGYYASGPRPLVEAARTAAGARATQLSLAVLLGGYEDGTSRNSWRSPTGETVAYFTALQAWRYPLSDVECLVLDPDADQADDADPADDPNAGDESEDEEAVGDGAEEARGPEAGDGEEPDQVG